jgi:DNA polymerase III alpha subunit
LFGAIEFYQEAQRAGLKPILPVFAAATTTLTATHHVVGHRYFR